MSEFHDLAELALNREGQSWGNLGYWKTATEYSDACRALAILLGEQAGLNRQSVVFDAGFGCGDQLILWLEDYRVAQVYGVNLSRSQTAYAKALLAQKGHSVASRSIGEGDINDADIWSALLENTTASHVLALDCAYHFTSRQEFLKLAHQHLAPTGTLALTDFILADQHQTHSFVHRLLRWMLARSHIAEANMVRGDMYIQQLQNAGFNDVHMLDISEHVMPAFAHAFRDARKGQLAGSRGERLKWSGLIKYMVTGRFLEWAYRRSILRYCVISATKTVCRYDLD